MNAGRSTGDSGGAAAKAAALHYHHVDVRLGDADILSDVTFDVPAGGFLAIIGPNGAGKSTLVKVGLGLIEPLRGHAAIFGVDAGDAPERIGYVPQLKTFERSFPATALELVVSGLRQRWPARIRRHERERACAALSQVGADRLTDRSLSRLSGGELQRVFLARALVRQPDIVFLDEPATGVDWLAEHDLYDLLDAYQADTAGTIAMITHDLAAARHHATHVLLLNRTVHGFGAPDDVLTDARLKDTYGHVGHEHSVLVV